VREGCAECCDGFGARFGGDVLLSLEGDIAQGLEGLFGVGGGEEAGEVGDVDVVVGRDVGDGGCGFEELGEDAVGVGVWWQLMVHGSPPWPDGLGEFVCCCRGVKFVGLDVREVAHGSGLWEEICAQKGKKVHEHQETFPPSLYRDSLATMKILQPTDGPELHNHDGEHFCRPQTPD